MSTLTRTTTRAAQVALTASTLFVADLFLTWEHADVRMPLMRVDAGGSGWSGAGGLAGVLALFVIVLVATRRRWAALLVATGMLAATALAVFGGGDDAHMTMRGLAVDADVTRWPAWAGLTLAAITLAACSADHLRASRG